VSSSLLGLREENARLGAGEIDAPCILLSIYFSDEVIYHNEMNTSIPKQHRLREELFAQRDYDSINKKNQRKSQ
jgi:hypothetical protein